MSKDRQNIIAVVGPTASGKSALAVELARRFHGEVISADSRQVYKGLDIGTGKVPGEWHIAHSIWRMANSKAGKHIAYGEWQTANGEWHIANGKWRIANGKSTDKRHYFFYKGIRHHCIDFASPKRQYTVAQYQTHARRVLHKLFAIGSLPIVCGGTGLYVDALLYDYPLPSVKPNAVLRKKLEGMSTDSLAALLKTLDPGRYATIDIRNPRRLIRAIEIARTLGSVPQLTIDQLHLTKKYNVLKIGIRVSKEDLQKKIRTRLMKRLRRPAGSAQGGLIQEVQQLHANGISWKRLDSLGLEYRYVGRYLQNLITKDVMIEVLVKEIYRYSKRQMTWFTRDSSIHWISTPREAISLIKAFLKK